MRASDRLEQRIDRVQERLRGFSLRGALLYLLPLPLLPALGISLLKGDLERIVGQAGALAACWGAAWLGRRGLREEEDWRQRRRARPPAPRKTAAALLLGAGVAGGAHVAVGHDLPLSALLGAGATAGFALAYGLDPRRRRGPGAASAGRAPEEVLRILGEADEAIARIESANRSIRSPELSERLERIAALARSVVALLEEDPRGLRRARRFLQVYLTGAQRVSEGYARTHRLGGSGELDESFRNVLDTIERVFAEQRQHLLEHDALDLDVQIEVLHRQLEREGVT